MVRLRLAYRNLLRNFRRTLVNLSMIVSGFAAIVVFDGFGENILRSMRKAFISVQYGHIQVGTNVSWDLKTVDDTNERLIANPQKIIDDTIKVAPFVMATGRLGFYAMLSTSDDSLSARAVSYNPSVEVGMRDDMVMVEGRSLNNDNAYEVMLGRGLVKSLQVKIGDRLTVLAQTVDGSINAIDVEVVGISMTGVAEIDNFTFYLPLKAAQNLLDTDRVERLVYFLPKDRDFVPQETKLLNEALPKELRARSWDDLATLYKQTEQYFGTQNIIVSIIILVLVLLSISNTVSNSIIERTGEIGTVRAMGDKRRDVIYQFLMEGILLSLLSGVIAIVVSAAVSIAVTSAHIRLPIPGTSAPIFVGIDILPWAYVRAFLLTAFTAVMATVYPAWKVSRLPIVDALKRNV